jgi:hypothetical protein
MVHKCQEWMLLTSTRVLYNVPVQESRYTFILTKSQDLRMDFIELKNPPV